MLRVIFVVFARSSNLIFRSVEQVALFVGVLLLVFLVQALVVHIIFLEADRGKQTTSLFRRGHHLVKLVFVFVLEIASDLRQIVEPWNVVKLAAAKEHILPFFVAASVLVFRAFLLVVVVLQDAPVRVIIIVILFAFSACLFVLFLVLWLVEIVVVVVAYTVIIRRRRFGEQIS